MSDKSGLEQMLPLSYVVDEDKRSKSGRPQLGTNSDRPSRSFERCTPSAGLTDELFRLEDPPDLYLALGLGLTAGLEREPLGPFDRLTHRFHLQDPVAGDDSLGPPKGPSVTVRSPPKNLTFTPSALQCSAARSTSTPAFDNSSLYLPWRLESLRSVSGRVRGLL